MLYLMRKHAKSWIVSLMIAAISIVFIFYFGTGSWRQQTITQVASVNGEPISLSDYNQRYNRLLELAQRQYREMLTDELLKVLNLRQRALEDLINERLIFQNALAMGLDVSYKEVLREIAKIPYFQVDGRFNDQRYGEMLGRLGVSHDQFIEGMRRDMVIARLKGLIGAQAHVSPGEVADFFHLARDRVRLDYVIFQPEDFRAQVKPTAEEITAYFTRNKENYRVPAKSRISYLAFRSSDFLAEAGITDNDIADHYETYLDQYSIPEQVKARHILIRVDRNADDDVVKTARAKAEDVLKKVQEKKGETFAELAEEYSEGPTADTGGDLGWFGRDQMVAEFSKAAFELEKGQVGGPVRTDFGFHIIKVEDRREAGPRPLEDVKEEIRRQLTAERTSDLAAAKAEEVYDAATLSQNFESTARDKGLTPITTPWFSEQTPLTDITPDPKFTQTALSLNVGEIGPLLEQDDGLYIIKCVDRLESIVPDLEDVRGQVEEDLAQEQALGLAKAAATAFLSAAKKDGWETAVGTLDQYKTTKPSPEAEENPWDGESITGPREPDDTATQSAGMQVQTTEPFSRNEGVPGIGGGEELLKTVFGLKTGQPAGSPFEIEKGHLAFRVSEKLQAPADELDGERDNIVRAIRINKSRAYVDSWLGAIREEAAVEVDERVL